MSYNVNFDTVAQSIAGLVFTGIQNLDIDKIPDNVHMISPVIFPKSDNYMTDLVVTNDSFGTGTGKRITLEYKLHYIYSHSAIGTKLTFGFYNGLVSNVAAIVSKLTESDKVAGLVDLQIDSVPLFGPISDPAGNAFFGCELVLNIKQFGEVSA